MAECECLQSCLFFNDKMKGMDATAEWMKEELCRKDNTGCARFLVFRALGKSHVPSDLFPRQVDRAQKIIGE